VKGPRSVSVDDDEVAEVHSPYASGAANCGVAHVMPFSHVGAAVTSRLVQIRCCFSAQSSDEVIMSSERQLKFFGSQMLDVTFRHFMPAKAHYGSSCSSGQLKIVGH
jgi:hypothetical protein